jgi:NAD(P)-dependent dehydrogenase (short-subunit alcohol dehydrogenase family)
MAAVFAERGAHVVGVGRREELGRRLEQEVRDAGGALSFLAADVSRPAGCAAAVAHTVATFGRIDVLINNAGVEGPVGHFHELTEEEWDATIDINVKGAAFCCRYAIPHMLEQGGGLVLNVASINAVEALAHMAPYNASKAAVVQLTRSLAVEYLAQGIRANTVILGGVAGGTNERSRDALVRLMGASTSREQAPGTADASPPRPNMMQDPREVAGVFALLCSDEARLITGATIALDRAVTAGFSASTLIHLKVAGQL